MFINFIITTLTIIFWFVVLLIPLVIFHEFGHFLMAKLTKTRVPEFGVGIPPRVASVRWKGVLWSLNSIPLGGFVRVFGDGDTGDAAMDAMDQIKQNTKKSPDKISKKLKNEALEELKSQYIQDRLQELIQNNEIDYFLETQGLVLNQEWINQIKKKNFDDDKLSQIKTLIDWEFEGLPKNKSAFFNKPFWAKVLVMLGGVIANFVLAWFILTMLLTLSSISQMILPDKPLYFSGVKIQFISESASNRLIHVRDNNDLTIGYVEPNSLAEKSGLKPEDKIMSLNDKNFESADSFIKDLIRLGGTNITLKIQERRNGPIVDKSIDLPVKEEGKPQLGLTPIDIYSYKAANFFDAALIALDIVWNTSLALFVFLGGIFSALFGFTANKELLGAVGGPVAIGAQGNSISRDFGASGILATMAMLSINLGVFNLLPVPALDGGRIVILTIQKITGKRNRKLEYGIVTATFILLILIGIGIAVKDIYQQISGV